MENKIEMEDAILKDQNNLSTPEASIYEMSASCSFER